MFAMLRLFLRSGRGRQGVAVIRTTVIFGGWAIATLASSALAGGPSASPGVVIVAQAESGSGTEGAPAETAPPEEAQPPAELPTVATVHVIAENIESASGTVWLALCNVDLSVEGCPYKKSVPASPGFVELTFEDVPPGEYAVVGYHDVDDNAEFNKLLGVPREPYALSAEAGDMLVPTFDDAKVAIAAGPNDVIIRMHGIVD